MTNFGTARIRKDSLSHPQSQGSLQSDSPSKSSSSSSSLLVLNSSPSNHLGGQLPADAQISGEGAHHLLEEAPRKKSEPFSEELGQAIHNLTREQHVAGARQGTVKTITPAALTIAAHPEPAPSLLPAVKSNTKRLSAACLRSTKSVRSSTPRLRPALSDPQIMTTRPAALLITSLGNPPPYHSTRHSAAHLVLKTLQSNLSLPPFSLKSKLYGGGHISHGSDVSRPEFTLWQSPSQMNVSGPPLLKAWKQFLATQKINPLDPVTGLVVLHDEMEIDPGRVKVRRGGNTSAKGHNGIKSVQGSLNGAGLMQVLGERFVKIGVGIGRPAGGSRDSRDVSAFVLGQLTAREKDGLDSAARELEGVLYAELARIGQI